jgi:hypothetical protein
MTDQQTKAGIMSLFERCFIFYLIAAIIIRLKNAPILRECCSIEPYATPDFKKKPRGLML